MVVDVAAEFAARVAAAVSAEYGLDVGVEGALVRPAAAGHGADLQANVAMGLAKRVGAPPPQVARRIADRLAGEDMFEQVRVDGPGFLNVRIRADVLGAAAAVIAADPRAGVPADEVTRRVVIDYSAPNVAKEMHVGHLRSTIIGDALARVIRFAGHEVIAQNHVGDWGTPFGMLIEYLVQQGLDPATADTAPPAIGDLNDFYRDARARFDTDPGFADRARARVVALQAGDELTLRLWRGLVEESQRHFRQVYTLLGVGLGDADVAGESFYDPMLADVVSELQSKGLLEDSDGALCLFTEGFVGRDGQRLPLIVRKRDGGYNYDTTDLAAIRYRTQDLKADDLLYVVGAPQRLHFEMIFAAARAAQWLIPPTTARHVGFGSVLGEDGKVLRTRAGAAVRLVDLLEEAVARAGRVLAERQEIPDEQRPQLAREVGIGAVKYADLSSGREKDYQFSFERMLAMEGNTSVYLQYANARIRSVLRKAGDPPPPGTAVLIGPDAERELVLVLTRFCGVLAAVAQFAEPHRLCTWLFEVAVAFSAFYESCPVLTAEPAMRASRLVLCQATSRALTTGLDLLGIAAPDRL